MLKLLAGPLLIFGLAAFLVVNQAVNAAPPPDKPAISGQNFAQESDVLLEKDASAESVVLGQPVTFTIRIQNNGQRTITPQMTDTLPDVIEGLALQDETITSTVGTVSAQHNVVTWSGTLEPGADATIQYQAVPPTTSSAEQELTNTAVLEWGDQSSLSASVVISTTEPDLGLWDSFVNFIAKALVFFDRSLEAVSMPYAFGFAIILFTLLVRGATFPLNMQQIKSSKAMQELQPQLKALQEKHKNDREKLAQEQMALYKEAGVNPLGGCLPMLVQMPIWIALYRALIQLSSEGLLSEGFFWIPSLAGPVSDWGGGINWVLPNSPEFVGWANAIAYLVMPVLLVVSQLYMQKLMTPPSSDPQQAQMQNIMKFMPLMFGYFALIVPSGLTLYWFTSNLLGMVQHYFTRTQLNPAPAGAAAGSSGSTSRSTASAAATSSGERKKQKYGKSKRKSRRKR